MGQSRRRLQWLAALVVAVGCGGLAWAALRTWRAAADVNAAQDLALREGGSRALPYLRLATQYRPDLGDAWRLRAQFRAFADPNSALQDARRAVAVDREDWRGWDRLGLVEFQLNDLAAARQALAEAVRRDSGWRAHYQLGNLALLLGHRAEFWNQLRAALNSVVAWQSGPLIAEAVRQAHGAPGVLLSVFPPDRVGVDSRAIEILLRQGMPAYAARVWTGMRCRPYQRAECRGVAINLANRLMESAFRAGGRAQSPAASPGASPPMGAAGLVAAAIQTWNLAVARHLLRAPVAVAGRVSDGDFQRPWIGPAFAWAKNGGVYLDREPGAAPVGEAVQIDFDGYESGNTYVFLQDAPVKAGAVYRISYWSRRRGGGTQSGLLLRVLAAPGEMILRLPASLADHWAANRGLFRVPARVHVVMIAFAYHRPLGQVRLHNPVQVAEVRLREVRR